MIRNQRKVSYRRGGVPALILEGKFLPQYGFSLGDDYSVDYQYGQITIVKIDKRLVVPETK
jgi:hypothetical protein